MAYSCPLTWSPVEVLPLFMTIPREQLVDLGYVNENGNEFVPRLYYSPFNFDGFLVRQNEAVRYEIQIEAENFTSPRYVVEVAWDGQWSFVPSQMRRHLVVRHPRRNRCLCRISSCTKRGRFYRINVQSRRGVIAAIGPA